MSKKNEYTKEDIKNIVQDEIQKFFKSSLDDEVKKIISKSNGASRKEMLGIVKHGLAKFAEFMFVRKGIWQGDIK